MATPRVDVRQEDLRKFIAQCLALSSISFPDCAEKVGLKWEKVKPYFKEEWFVAEMANMLEVMKYQLADKLMYAALNGSTKYKPAPSVAHIKAVMELIDSGALLGKLAIKSRESEGSGEGEPEEIDDELKKRMGL